MVRLVVQVKQIFLLLSHDWLFIGILILRVVVVFESDCRWQVCLQNTHNLQTFFSWSTSHLGLVSQYVMEPVTQNEFMDL